MALYENFVNDNEEKFVRMGRNLITLCELNKLYPKNDEMWNAAVTAGNKLVTINTTYGMKSLSELKDNEKKFLMVPPLCRKLGFGTLKGKLLLVCVPKKKLMNTDISPTLTYH